PRSCTDAATRSTSSAVRADTTTSAPASAKASAIAAPIPLPPPVTIATCPSSRNRSSTFSMANPPGCVFRRSDPRRAILEPVSVRTSGDSMPSVKTPSAPTDHYTIISADCHAGGSHAMYREYLDQAYRDDFDAWRNKYKNPYRDLRDTDLRIRNWD